MSDRSTAAVRSWTTLIAALLLAVGVVAPEARAQRASGSIDVSLTVLPPVSTQAIRVTSFSVDRSGVARVETTAPISAQATQLVMARVSSSATGFVPQAQTPSMVPAASTSSRLRYLVNVGRAPRASETRDIALRVEYLAVAGT